MNERIKTIENVISYRKHLLEIELIRLTYGQSNSRLIYEAEEKLSDAKQLHIETVMRFRTAMAQLERVTGSVLQRKTWSISMRVNLN